MVLDDMKQAWSSSNQSNSDLAINEDKLISITRKSKGKLSEFRTDNLAELIIYSFLMLYLGNFLQSHLSEPKFFFAGMILFVLSGINVVFNIYALDFYGRLSPSSKITELQNRLSRIRLYLIWERYLMVILIPLYIIPFGLVVAKGVLGVDLFPLLSVISFKIIASWSIIGTLIVFLITRGEMRRLKKVGEDLKTIREFERG
jgi:hypothetical protein